MKSIERTKIDNILIKHLGERGVTTRHFVHNDNHKTFRRFKYNWVYATKDQLGSINADLASAFPNNKVTAYLTDDDASSYSSMYHGLAVRLYHNTGTNDGR